MNTADKIYFATVFVTIGLLAGSMLTGILHRRMMCKPGGLIEQITKESFDAGLQAGQRLAMTHAAVDRVNNYLTQLEERKSAQA